ncbi:uncharacterized protein sS8_1410 [Methylocaldum marinum]|uniref:Uncharacterized protein n=1 Tax=Methylocaldum marinum TaxID=1432792 RepID=A0A250KNW5_9GAMM|nr:hypothetical protein [Methylocaldum marinum]BBA33370.1 uncharacterized protein sS8_1410 [Methylocaldum marinum]
MFRRPAFLVLPLLFFTAVALADRLPRESVPEPLKPWAEWVLHGHEDRACPLVHGNPEERRCVWPTRLELELDERAGRFTLKARVYTETWLPLPGDVEHWPQQVEIGGKSAVVVTVENSPGIRVAPGEHTVKGRFMWDRLPENLTIPNDTAMISLVLKGQSVPLPAFNEQGQLWIYRQASEDAAPSERADTVDVRVYRRVIDDMPLRTLTHIDLDVSGRQREILLDGGLPADSIPLQVSSPLPARLEPDGKLRLQLRPGHWSVELGSRFPGPVESLRRPPATAPWPAEEIWVFDARPQLRVVEVEGVPAVDPRQTNLPDEWKALPAYRMDTDAMMTLKLIRRGDPEPEPDSLTLHRRIWLDFDGGGYTVNDGIGGRMTRDWRLNVRPDVELGQVSIDGQPQSITREDDSGAIGVEMRRGAVNLSADSRIAGVRTFSATGWDQDFQNASAELNLPPGWRLFAATGVDHAPGTWVARWTLLDLFVVLITAMGVARLWSWPYAALTLVALALLWHEPDAPRYVWLNILAAAALLTVLPEGKAASAVRIYRNLAVLALILIAIPFMVDQARFALYPQLEQPWMVMPSAAAPAEFRKQAEEPVAAPETMESYAPRRKLYEQSMPPASPSTADIGGRVFRETDPNAITQTGPGLPDWQWKSISLGWSGPVLRDQEVGLILLSPTINLLLNFLRIALVIALAVLFVTRRPPLRPFSPRTAMPLLWLPLVLFVPDAKAAFPDPALLEELKSRLLAPSDCLPQCAEIPLLKLETRPSELRQTLEIHAQELIALPLPINAAQWIPSRVEVDNRPAEGLFRGRNGGLWLALAPGRHVVTLAGILPARDQLQLPLPLKPRRVEASGEGWRVEGIRENGVPDVQLQLVRIANGDRPADKLPTLESRPLPPFLEVERTLKIGLDWRMVTVVRRASPPDRPVVVGIPLIGGESVVSPGLQIEDGKVVANLLPGQHVIRWESVLAKAPAIDLKAPDTTDWIEIWRADISPIWHMDPEGLVVIHHQDAAGNWLPEWRPWPGESVTLRLTRPQGVPGNTLTIDRSRLQLNPGIHATDATLTLSLRSSQGGQHTLKLPEDVELQSVVIDGATHPVRQQERLVSLPIHPGEQTATLEWRDRTGIRNRLVSPEVELGAPSVNSTITFSLGQDRWVLLVGGPRLGPAVLIWGVLIVIALLSVALGRLPWTPIKFWQWLLLLIGLSQIPASGGVVVAGWLLTLGWRAGAGTRLNDLKFNLLQVGLAILTVAALALLLEAVHQGLLGLPDMQIAGNGSGPYHLNWYQDRSGPTLPRPWAVSAPLWVYRVLMLAWALWLAYALLNWLRWGWTCYASGGLWRPRKKKEKPAKAESGEPTQPD